MSSAQASRVKRRGHKREQDLCDLVGGHLHQGAPTDKADIVDQYGNAHSVKSGQWWQIFLYGRDRFITNTNFQDVGSIAEIMVQCIDVFPERREDYLADKNRYKFLLQAHMRRLKTEFDNVDTKIRFFRKSIFNDTVDLLSIQLAGDTKFHVFERCDVVYVLTNTLAVENSKANNPTQYDDQKVVFRHLTNVGEIEIRNDSDIHYRQGKFRLNSTKIFTLLETNIPDREEINGVQVYGSAIPKMRRGYPNPPQKCAPKPS